MVGRRWSEPESASARHWPSTRVPVPLRCGGHAVWWCASASGCSRSSGDFPSLRYRGCTSPRRRQASASYSRLGGQPTQSRAPSRSHRIRIQPKVICWSPPSRAATFPRSRRSPRSPIRLETHGRRSTASHRDIKPMRRYGTRPTRGRRRRGGVTVTLGGDAAIAMTVLEIAGASSTPLHGVADAGDRRQRGLHR